MTKREIVDGFMSRFDWYKDLIEHFPEHKEEWCKRLGEVFTTAMWIGAISTEQYGILSDMLSQVRFSEE